MAPAPPQNLSATVFLGLLVTTNNFNQSSIFFKKSLLSSLNWTPSKIRYSIIMRRLRQKNIPRSEHPTTGWVIMTEDEANNIHQMLIHKDNIHHTYHLTILLKLALFSISNNSKQKTKRKPKKMAMKLWASSTANALKISCTNRTGATPFLAFSISRCFSSVWDGLKYSSSHEWIKHEGSVATIGITDHAQGQLGELVFVELPEPGSAVSKGVGFGAVESVKATSDVNSPISGQVVEVNTKLAETPGLINSSPYGDGWMIKVRPSSPSELEALMDPGEYTKFCEEEDAHH